MGFPSAAHVGLAFAPSHATTPLASSVAEKSLVESKKESVQTHLDAFFPLRATGTAQYRPLSSLSIVEAIDFGSCFRFRKSGCCTSGQGPATVVGVSIAL